MTSNKSPAAEDREAEARTFIRLQLGGEVARAASHIRSKRAAALRVGIEESRASFQGDYGDASVRPFLECVEGWLSERGNMVAAAALRAYLESDSVSCAAADTAAPLLAPEETLHPSHRPQQVDGSHHHEAGSMVSEKMDANDATAAVASPISRQPPNASRPRRRSDTARTTRSYRSSRSH